MENTNNAQEEQRFYTLSECAEIMRVSVTFVRRRMLAGEIKAYKPARAYLIENSELERFIHAHEVGVNG